MGTGDELEDGAVERGRGKLLIGGGHVTFTLHRLMCRDYSRIPDVHHLCQRCRQQDAFQPTVLCMED